MGTVTLGEKQVDRKESADFSGDGWPVHPRHVVVEKDELVHLCLALHYLLDSFLD